jgi:hypothetical protein
MHQSARVEMTQRTREPEHKLRGLGGRQTLLSRKVGVEGAGRVISNQ